MRGEEQGQEPELPSSTLTKGPRRLCHSLSHVCAPPQTLALQSCVRVVLKPLPTGIGPLTAVRHSIMEQSDASDPGSGDPGPQRVGVWAGTESCCFLLLQLIIHRTIKPMNLAFLALCSLALNF